VRQAAASAVGVVIRVGPDETVDPVVTREGLMVTTMRPPRSRKPGLASPVVTKSDEDPITFTPVGNEAGSPEAWGRSHTATT